MPSDATLPVLVLGSNGTMLRGFGGNGARVSLNQPDDRRPPLAGFVPCRASIYLLVRDALNPLRRHAHRTPTPTPATLYVVDFGTRTLYTVSTATNQFTLIGKAERCDH